MKVSLFRFICLLLILEQSIYLYGQNKWLPPQGIDILHYEFSLELFDDTDAIAGKAHIFFQVDEQVSPEALVLDLIGKKEGETGMEIESVGYKNSALSYTHNNEKLHIQLPQDFQVEHAIEISYKGIPADGLIISKNKYGDRTFFGDNWPNRARNWLPVIDHPSDKATVSFKITVPEKYQAVANGTLLEESDLPENKRLYHWKSEAQIPTKVMVIGVAEFAVQYLAPLHGIPVSSWVYPQDREAGFHDYALAEKVLDFFVENVGPYPYKKLANVQSKTRFGGMENASNIFYSENSVDGKGSAESLIAHEIAHQWFGNSASESNWQHIWLSEGFATYMTALYLEDTYGVEALQKSMEENRQTVLSHAPPTGVVPDPSQVADLMFLLNANSYQKGGWVLHMLRQEVGTEKFWQIVRTYYTKYAEKNASSQDFQEVAEKISGKNLEAFFQQWLYRPYHPELTWTYSYDQASQNLTIMLTQSHQGEVFDLPLYFDIMAGGNSIIHFTRMEKREHSFTIPLKVAPSAVNIDPNVSLLAKFTQE